MHVCILQNFESSFQPASHSLIIKEAVGRSVGWNLLLLFLAWSFQFYCPTVRPNLSVTVKNLPRPNWHIRLPLVNPDYYFSPYTSSYILHPIFHPIFHPPPPSDPPICLFVFYVPSTARSFKDGTPIYCPLRRTWNSVNTPYPPGIEPRAVVWQSITLPLHHASFTPICWAMRRRLF